MAKRTETDKAGSEVYRLTASTIDWATLAAKTAAADRLQRDTDGARAAAAAGLKGKARRYYGQLVALGSSGDNPRPEILEARKFLEGR